MKILQARPFERVFKKLHASLQREVESAIREIISNPLIGDLKIQDIHGLRVYKFRMNKQLTLLAYQYDEPADTLVLETVGPRENFYRDLKKAKE